MSRAIKLRTVNLDTITELRVLLTHPMENGRNRDPLTGMLIPAHFIQTLQVKLNGQSIIHTDLGGSVAKNPFFTFRLRHVASGDLISVEWHDNLGDSEHEEWHVP